MIIHGDGLLARAFHAHADIRLPGVVFARGVSDSGCTDEDAYRRELDFLKAASASALELGEPIVYFCGAPIYGISGSMRRERDELHPRTRYGRHQRDAERTICESGATYLIVRTANVVGPGGHAHQLIPALVRQAKAGSVSFQSDASRDLLDVEDLVLLTQRLLANGSRDLVVNVASGVSTPVEAIVRRIVEILATRVELVAEPGGERQRFDIGRLKGILGPLNFDESYPYRILDLYVPVLGASIG